MGDVLVDQQQPLVIDGNDKALVQLTDRPDPGGRQIADVYLDRDLCRRIHGRQFGITPGRRKCRPLMPGNGREPLKVRRIRRVKGLLDRLNRLGYGNRHGSLDRQFADGKDVVRPKALVHTGGHEYDRRLFGVRLNRSGDHHRWFGHFPCRRPLGRVGYDTGSGESLADGFGNNVLDSLTPAKAYFGLGRMDVDIDLIMGDIDEQKGHWIHAVREHGTKPLEQSAGDRLVTDKPVVYKEILRVLGRPALARCRDVSTDPGDIVTAAADRQQTVEQPGTEYLKRPLTQILCRRNPHYFTAIVGEFERYLRVCQSVMSNDRGEVIIFGRLGAHEFASGRRIKE